MTALDLCRTTRPRFAKCGSHPGLYQLPLRPTQRKEKHCSPPEHIPMLLHVGLRAQQDCRDSNAALPHYSSYRSAMMAGVLAAPICHASAATAAPRSINRIYICSVPYNQACTPPQSAPPAACTTCILVRISQVCTRYSALHCRCSAANGLYQLPPNNLLKLNTIVRNAGPQPAPPAAYIPRILVRHIPSLHKTLCDSSRYNPAYSAVATQLMAVRSRHRTLS
jgi:hypothetical protein